MTAEATASAIPNPTELLGLYRYPEGSVNTDSPDGGVKMESPLALRTDVNITFWWRISTIGTEETWAARDVNPDGSCATPNCGIQVRYYIDPTTEDECLDGSYLSSGQVIWHQCASWMGDVYLGVARRPNPYSEPLHWYTREYLHNGEVEQTFPYLLSDVELVNATRVDVNAKLINSAGQLSTDINKIAPFARFDYAARYATTDGITPIYLVTPTAGDVPVTYQIDSGVTADGGLSTLDGQQQATTVQPPVQATTGVYGMDYAAAAIYTVPPEFSDSPNTAPSRTIMLSVTYALPNQATPAVIQKTLTLIRPPLLLIHGMWSNPDTVWGDLLSNPTINSLRPWRTVNWSPADTPLRNNLGRVQDAIASTLAELRSAQVAVTQFDTIAHSAGGPLFRLWAQTPGYRRAGNFMQGDFRKLLTIGSPHHGTPIANFVQTLLTNANPIIVNAVKFAFAKFGHSVTNGIISDLQTTSATMTGLQPTPGRAHVWIGDLPSLPSTGDERRLWDLLSWICSTRAAQSSVPQCASIRASDRELLRSRVFSYQLNDGLVPHDMQTGGVAVTAQTILSNTPHTLEPQTISPVEVAGILDGTTGGVDAGGLR